MARINIDNTASELPVDPNRNLGDLLEDVLATLPPNRIVTGIAVDGKFISRSEKAAFLTQNLQQVTELSVRTTDKAIWTANGVDMALSCLESIQKSLIVVAELFRDNNIAEANHFFAHCIEGLERYTEIILITRTALKLDFNHIVVDQLNLMQMEEQLSLILQKVLECQQEHDHPGIADRIEYELIPNLCNWASGLRKIKSNLSSNA